MTTRRNKKKGGKPMANNTLVIEKNEQGLEVKVIDGDGVAHDITPAFRSIVGSTTPAAVTNQVKAQSGDTGVSVDFVATSKNMEFGLDPSVVKQLIALES